MTTVEARQIRTALVTEVIAPTRVPILNRLAADPRLDLTVFFLSETEKTRAWSPGSGDLRCRYEIVPSVGLVRSKVWGTSFLTPSLARRLRRGRFDCVVLGGYHHPSTWLALTVGGPRRILWSESPRRSREAPVRDALKRLFVSRMDGFLVPGTPQKEALQALGARTDRIWVAPNAVETGAIEAATRQREAHRTRLGLRGPTVLFVGRLLEMKGLRDLIEAFARIRAGGSQAQLVIVGDGPDRRALEELAHSIAPEGVRFEGFIQPRDLPPYYASADVFAFPTHADAWGLVLNEALAAGLPAVVSRGAGAARDLVEDGVSGVLHDPGDVDAIGRALTRVLVDADLRKSMSNAAASIAARYRPENMAARMADAVVSLVEGARK